MINTNSINLHTSRTASTAYELSLTRLLTAVIWTQKITAGT